MPRNASGTYTLPSSNPVVTQTPISSGGWANPTMTDLANALTDSISKNGVTTPTTNLPMGGFRHLSVAAATALDHYATANQLQTGVLQILASVTMAVQDVYTASLVLSPTSFIKNQLLIINFPAPNVGAASLNINGTGARQILKASGTALSAGACKVNEPFIIIYDGTDWRMFIDSSGFTSSDVVNALGYVPVNPNGSVPMTGQLTLVTPPVATTDAASKAYVDAGVRSFNTRTGAVALAGSDVTTALGYTPANAAGQVFTGAVQSKAFNQTPYVANISGATTIDYTNGQSQILTCTGAVSIAAINNVSTGTIIRLSFKATDVGLITSWPANVRWSGLAPDLSSGTLKKAIVVMEQDGTDLLATYAVY